MAAKIAACLLNVSEARNYTILKGIVEAALKDQHNWKPWCGLSNNSADISNDFQNPFTAKAACLNIFADVEYNRSVITLASPIEYLEQCLFQACVEALDKIDLRNQDGGHPRLGAVDLIPIHPLNDSLSLNECGEVAQRLGKRIVQQIPGTSAFFFGHADIPLKKGIVEKRKAVNWYAGKHGTNIDNAKWDVGERPTNRYGIIGIGAMPYMTNFNITVDTDDIVIGNTIAKHIRETSPNGLKGVQCMAFSHDKKIEIACNVETLDLQMKNTYAGPAYASFDDIERAVNELCQQHGVIVSGTALIGFKPEEVLKRTIDALTSGSITHLMQFDNKRM